MEYNFDDIRYYNDEDFLKFVPELAKEPTLQRVLRFYNQSDVSPEEVESFFTSFKSLDDFQLNFIIHLLEKIIRVSVSELTFDGLENIDPDKNYVFISNHRNIVMDVATLNYVLYSNFKDKFKSTAIAIGNNLLNIPWVKHLARMNKSFLVERDLPPQEMLLSAKRLSAYIRHIITSGQDSIWIAHREGRTKDGNDFTQAGLIKMLTMSGEGVFAENIGELHVIPLVISYEKDPCIDLKIKELAQTQQGEKYVKGPMEDFESMYRGMMGDKGRVHYHFGPEFTKEQLLKINEDIPVNQKVRNFCETLDRFIYQNYRLFPANYIAADLVNAKQDFTHLYTQNQMDEFISQKDELLQHLEGDASVYEDIYLKMYAYPVRNYYSVMESNYKFNF